MKLGFLANLFGQGALAVVALLLIPNIAGIASRFDFNVISLTWAAVGFFSGFDFGFARAVSWHVAQSASERESYGYIQSGLLAVVLLGTASAVVAGGGFLLGGWAGLYQAGESGALVQSLMLQYWTIAISIFCQNILRGVFEVESRFVLVNVVRIPFQMLVFALPYAMFRMGFGAAACVTGLMGVYVGQLAVSLMVLVWLKRDVFGAWHASRAIWAKLYVYGKWILLSSFAGPFMTYCDRFVLAWLMPGVRLAPYVIANEAGVKINGIAAALASVTYGRVANGNGGMEAIYRKSIMFIGVIAALFTVFLFAFIDQILQLWLHDKAEPIIAQLCLIFVAGAVFNSMAQIPFVTIQGLGYPKVVARLQMQELLLYGVLLIPMVWKWGLIGGAMSWAIRVSLDFFILHFLCKRLLKQEGKK